MRLAAALSVAAATADAAPIWPRTRAERSAGGETSSYADVLAFFEAVRACGAPVTVEPIGRSPKGREIPLVVVANPPASASAEARATDRLVIYLQANIHGGEVEGKEAVQMLVREVAQGLHPEWLKHFVIVATPIYNIDGNENWGDGLKNRSHQNGPPTVGTRANGAGLDLNRDGMKADSAEMQAVLARVFRRWDPHVTIDLHTTNGTRHGLALTYSPPLHPDTNPDLLSFVRDELLPAVRRRMTAQHQLQTFDYGNVIQRDKERAWSTFSPQPRFVTNYVGLRNRLAILSEATSYLPFTDRIEATRRFVGAVLGLIAEHPDHVAALTRAADHRTVNRGAGRDGEARVGIRFEPVPRGDEAVPLERSEVTKGRRPHESPGDLERVVLPIYDRFRATATTRLPAAYLLPNNERRVVRLLKRHGLRVQTITASGVVAGEKLRLDTVEVSAQPTEGHCRMRVAGRFEDVTVNVSPGSYLVPTAQPLGTLAAHLLEPEGLDGVTAWGLLAATLIPGNTHPIAKLRSSVRTLAPVPDK